jgi:hypothetical protein
VNSIDSSQYATFRRCVAAMLAATAVRIVVLVVLHEQLSEDRDAYMCLAKTWFQTGTYGMHTTKDGSLAATAYRSPLFPLLLRSLLEFPWDPRISLAVLHLVLGLATCAVVWKTVVRLGLGRHAPAAILLVACDPLLLENSTLVMSETAAASLAALSFLLLVAAEPYRSPVPLALAGVSLALASLCRPIFVPVTTAVVCGLAAGVGSRQGQPQPAPCLRNDHVQFARIGHRHGFRSRCGATLPVITAALLLYAPWPVRNWIVFGRPVVTTTHGGYTLHLGNNPGFYAYLRQASWNTVWRGESQIIRQAEDFVSQKFSSADWPRRELVLDRYHYREALRSIAQEPASFVAACLFRIGSLWQLWPRAVEANEALPRRLARYGVGVWYLLLAVLTIRGTWRLRGRIVHSPWLWIFLYLAVFTTVHTFYWCNMRMRAPLMPLLAVLAVTGWAKDSELERTIQGETE